MEVKKKKTIASSNRLNFNGRTGTAKFGSVGENENGNFRWGPNQVVMGWLD